MMIKKLFSLLFIGALCFAANSAQAQWTNKYKSYNFYGNGVTEYIIAQSAGGNAAAQYWYYTSSNAQRIKLVVISTKTVTSGMEGSTIVKVKFPSGKVVYTLEFIAGGMYCLAPGGKKQAYDYMPN